MPLLRVKRHIVAISYDHECSVSPSRFQQSRRKLLALLTRPVLGCQQIAQPLFEAVNGIQGRMRCQVSIQTRSLLASQDLLVAAHQRAQSPVAAADDIDLPPANEQVLVDQPDNVEPIRHNPRIREVLAHYGAVNRGQGLNEVPSGLVQITTRNCEPFGKGA